MSASCSIFSLESVTLLSKSEIFDDDVTTKYDKRPLSNSQISLSDSRVIFLITSLTTPDYDDWRREGLILKGEVKRDILKLWMVGHK